MMPGSSQRQGPNNQGSALGILTASRTSRVELGTERNTGVAGNSPTGAAMQANAAVGNAMTTPAQGF